MSANFMESVV